jgi:hypothetical protein
MDGVARHPTEVHGMAPKSLHLQDVSWSAARASGPRSLLPTCERRPLMGSLASSTWPRSVVEADHGWRSTTSDRGPRYGSEESPLTGRVMERCQSIRPVIPPSHL